MMRLSVIVLAVLAGLGVTVSATAENNNRLVFGSFERHSNAINWAAKLTTQLNADIRVETMQEADRLFYRVVTQPLAAERLQQLRQQAGLQGLAVWRLLHAPTSGAGQTDQPTDAVVIAADVASAETPDRESSTGLADQPGPTLAESRLSPASPVTLSPTPAATHRREIDWDVALQSRVFADAGVLDEARVTGSVSVQFDYYAGWQNDRQSITFSPFFRYDSADNRRTHADVRELYYTLVGANWDLHVGAKKVFWGVTEFHHLVDIINQTDLVENIDGEDKLGQPMLQASLIGDWGLLDVYALVGFRERTFPGTDGRLRHPLLISSDASYESGAGRHRVDGAIRWSHNLGPVEFGLHHFSGTSREPLFDVVALPAGDFKLEPYYVQIEQSGLDAQAIFGNWVVKLEGIHRSGFGPSYAAANLGLERTFFGVGDSSADVGLVLEYMYDERKDDAFNTLFENDLVIGGRFSFNNFADTQVLIGVITDLDTDEMIFSVEGSHRLGDSWLLSIEGRGFAGGESYQSADLFPSLTDRVLKSSWLQDEDYVQLELKKFF